MKPHPIYDEYYGTKDGKVFSTKWNKLKQIKPVLNKCNNGYYVVHLRKDGKKYQVYHHRFIADIFLPNPDNLNELNHIDEDKGNNCVENLEWATRKHNVSYSLAKEYIIENVVTGEKNKIRNLSDWCKENKIPWGSAMDNARGTTKTIRKVYKIHRS